MRFITLLLIGVFSSTSALAETAYERVIRTNTLRCGYILWPLSIDKDPNTGSFSGMNYDFVNKMGEKLGLKIDWTLEVLSGTQIENLKSGKIDAICASEGPLQLTTARYLAYTDPIMYGVFYAYARADDDRFDSHWNRINKEDVRISVLDGDNSEYMARTTFPKAQMVGIPASGDMSLLVMNVVHDKADVVIMDPQSAAGFTKNNPRKLKRVLGIRPIGYIPNTLSVLNSEGQLLNLLNVGVMGVHAYGDAEIIFKKYESKFPAGTELFSRPSLPFQTRQP